MTTLFIIKSVCIVLMFIYALTLKNQIKEENSVEKNLTIGLKGILYTLIIIAICSM